MKDYQLVTDKFACLIILNEQNVIIHTSALLRRFHGQSIRNLLRWAQITFRDCKLIDLDNNQVLYEKLN